MNTQAFYHTALVLHIIGLTMMAGITLADYIITRLFWKQYTIDRPKAIVLNQVLSKFPRPQLFGIGMLLLILSGVTMMAITNGVFGEQVWFRIKFVLILIIIINALVFGRRMDKKFRKFLVQESASQQVSDLLQKMKMNISLFQLSQLTLFVIIFTLSVFKFN